MKHFIYVLFSCVPFEWICWATPWHVEQISRLSLDASLFQKVVQSDYAEAKALYEDGRNSCSQARGSWTGPCLPRTLQNLTVARSGNSYSDAYNAFYGSASSWNEILTMILDGVGVLASRSTFRSMLGKYAMPGIGNMMMHEALDQASSLVNAGDILSGGVAIEESWAFYYGIDGNGLPAITAGKRDLDYPTGVRTREVVPELYSQLRVLLGGQSVDVSQLVPIVEAIYKSMLITFIRATIKYSYKVEGSLAAGAYSAKYHAEAYMFWRAISGYVGKHNHSAAQTVEDLLSVALDADSIDTEVHCKVKGLLEGTYATLGIDCTMVGSFKDYHPNICGATCTSQGVAVIPVFGYPERDINAVAGAGGYSAVSNTTTFALISKDTKIFTSVVSDYALAADIYKQGMNAPGYTLQDLNQAHVGGIYYTAYEAFYGSPSSWHDFLSLALNGSQGMSTKDATFRQTALKKGVLGLVTMAVHECLDVALRYGEDYLRADSQAAALVDQAWALYYGAEGLDGKSSPYGVSAKRDSDFPTGTQVSKAVLPLFQQAQVALRAQTYDAASALNAIKGIYRHLLITFIRATIKYAYKIQVSLESGSYSSKYHSEGYAYWRGASGYIASLNGNAAAMVEDSLLWTRDATNLDPNLHCKVKQALEMAYPSFGVDCSMIGVFKEYSFSVCGSACVSPMVPALLLGNPASLALPILPGAGLPDIGTYPPLYDVTATSEIAKETAAFTTAIVNYTLATQIYELGMPSSRMTLQSLNAPHPGDPYWEAYRQFYSSNSSWDDLIMIALSGLDEMANKIDVFRQMIAKKGVLGLVAMAVHERLEVAIVQARSGNHEKAVQAWDEAWALYYGDGKNAPFAVSAKRDTDFPGGVKVHDIMAPLFMQGQKHLEHEFYDIEKVLEAKSGIYKGMMISFIRCAIKYSYKTQESILEGQYSAKYHSEGYAYWRGASAFIASYNVSAARSVEDSLLWTLDAASLKTDMHCTTKLSLEGSYAALGIDCSMIGDFVGYSPDVCGSLCASPSAPALPAGIRYVRQSASCSCTGAMSSDVDSAQSAHLFCSVGEEFNGLKCQKCPAGKSNAQSDDTCTACPPGFFSDSEGSSECQSCPEGTFAGGDVFTGNSFCEQCPPGKVSSSKGSNRCIACDKGQYASAAGNRVCDICPSGKYSDSAGSANCTECEDRLPGGTSSQGARSHEDCFCKQDMYESRQEKRCIECAFLKETRTAGAISQDDCHFGASFYILVFVPAGIFVMFVVAGIASIILCKMFKRMEQVQAEDKIVECIQYSRDLAFPMVLMGAIDFRTIGRLISYEEGVDRKILRIFPTVQEVKRFAEEYLIVFFSHQWLSWTEPDPENLQYNGMIEALGQVLLKMHRKAEDCFLWIDYHSVPQESRQLQNLAINTLPFFAALARLLVVVAPTALHAETQKECNYQTYQKRLWCRAELFSFYCKRGVSDMYKFVHRRHEPELMNLSEEDIIDSILVFEGDCTCCARDHVGMNMCDKEVLRDVLLGLYADVLWSIYGTTECDVEGGVVIEFCNQGHATSHKRSLRNAKSRDLEEIVKSIRKRKDRIFPKSAVITFAEKQKSRFQSDLVKNQASDDIHVSSTNTTVSKERKVKKQLFGTMIDTLESMIQHKPEVVQHLFETKADMVMRKSSSRESKISRPSKEPDLSNTSVKENGMNPEDIEDLRRVDQVHKAEMCQMMCQESDLPKKLWL